MIMLLVPIYRDLYRLQVTGYFYRQEVSNHGICIFKCLLMLTGIWFTSSQRAINYYQKWPKQRQIHSSERPARMASTARGTAWTQIVLNLHWRVSVRQETRQQSSACRCTVISRQNMMPVAKLSELHHSSLRFLQGRLQELSPIANGLATLEW